MSTPAGRGWVTQFPTSRNLDDLVEPFQTGVRHFLEDLAARGAAVHVSATRRPAERAWLMSFAWRIGSGELKPAEVPVHPGIDIEWTLEGAREMVSAYGLAYKPSLTSRHISGRAIDVTITKWAGTTAELWALGARHGVHKLPSDPPHWSDDGR